MIRTLNFQVSIMTYNGENVRKYFAVKNDDYVDIPRVHLQQIDASIDHYLRSRSNLRKDSPMIDRTAFQVEETMNIEVDGFDINDTKKHVYEVYFKYELTFI